MVYFDFLLMLNRAKNNNNSHYPIDVEAFSIYLSKIDNLLTDYFKENGQIKNYNILKLKASGKTLEQIGDLYHVTRERVRQIIAMTLDKFKNVYSVEGSKNLNALFSLLCSIGETEIIDFLYYLVPKKHILLLVLPDDWKDINPYHSNSVKPARKNIGLVMPKHQPKRATTEEYKKAIYKVIHELKVPRTFNYIANLLVIDYKNDNRYGFSGSVTWNKAMTVLFDMELVGEIVRCNGKIYPS